MEKRLIATLVAAAFAGTAGVASAGPVSVSGAINYASETVTAAAGIILGNVAYSLSFPLAEASTQIVRYTLDGDISSCPNLSVGGLPYAGTLLAGNRICSYTVLTVGAVPINSVASFTGGIAAPAAAPALAAGGKLTAVVSIRTTSGSVTETSEPATVATAGHAFSGSITSSSAFVTPELSRVNVGSTPPSTNFSNPPGDLFVNTQVINLGRFRVSKNEGVFYDADGVTEVTFASLTTNSWKMTVSGPFVANLAGEQVYLASNTACAFIQDFVIVDGVAEVTYAVGAGGAAIPNQNLYACYFPNRNLPTATVAIKAILTGQFSGTLKTTIATPAATDPTKTTGESASGNLYNLLSNGAQIDLRVMTTAATTGWNTVVRVINTGRLEVPVTATYLNADGSLGASNTIIASLKPGATAMLSAAQIEAALGVSLAATGNPPRLRISAPTDNLRAQAWVQSPNGAWFMGTPAQGNDSTGGGDFQ